ncbi:pre-mRNA-splicing factor [Perilla frutescens var. hirtella]|nr:pre-mRNA-splicing factor [Perilla frutescens var. hirtella]
MFCRDNSPTTAEVPASAGSVVSSLSPLSYFVVEDVVATRAQIDVVTAAVTRKPDKEMSEHDRKRKIELKLLALEEKLIDLGCTDSEIAEKIDEARNSLRRIH